MMSETERLMTKWGAWSRDTMDRLGYPRSTSIARVIELVNVFEQQRKGVKRKALKKAKRKVQDCGECSREFSIRATHCPKCGWEVQVSHGTTTLSFRSPTIGEIPSDVLRVEGAINRLPGWMQKTLHRSYRFNQPDRMAAQELRMTKQRYREQREAAIAQLSEILAQRAVSAVPFKVPRRREAM